MAEKDEEFNRRAEEAEKMAAAAKTEYERDAFLQIAHGWRDLLVEAERRRKRT